MYYTCTLNKYFNLNGKNLDNMMGRHETMLWLVWGVTDGRVVRAGVSVTWNVLSQSGGHEFEPRSVDLWVHSRPTSVLSRTWTKKIALLKLLLTHIYDRAFLIYNRPVVMYGSIVFDCFLDKQTTYLRRQHSHVQSSKWYIRTIYHE